MLYHFSEEPDILRFEPRVPVHRPDQPAMVWAIDAYHAPHYFFPRNCPRICIWANENTTQSDMERFFGLSSARRMIAVEAGWLDRIRETVLYRYSFRDEDFTLYEANAGYYTCPHTVEPVSVEPVGDLLQRLSSSGIELRITPSLKPLRDAVLSSSVGFSMIRMMYANMME